ncbi:BCCT family transporter [Leisingera sp.]|uniref:BCCT family transporter n=1 Tax=Leisingera sp. TaxID=1879318 RepID=UPI003A912C0B
MPSFKGSIRPLVFWPPFILLITAVLVSLVNLDQFLAVTTAINNWILSSFSWLFSLATLVMVLTLIAVFFSPLGKTRIGGEAATPLLTKWRWFSISLCTTVAIGIMFWATAEPMYHLHYPPAALGAEADSPEAMRFALSTMFLHWSFTPYSIYSVPALAFALAYYNHRKPFSLGSALSPVFGSAVEGKGGQIIDAIALYTLVAGMAASLGTGALTLAGGVDKYFGTGTGPIVLGVLTALIVLSAVASAASGLHRGIARLSSLNTRIFFVLAGFVFIAGPTGFILAGGVEALGDYLGNFFQKSLTTGALSGDAWAQGWTIFYWANWLAWAPITALFLGKIARGYTVRQFLLVNLVAPSVFACVWMSIFAGTALFMDSNNDNMLFNALNDSGPETVVYTMLSNLPLAGITAALFIFTSFLSYVTAADSNTEAIANLCVQDGAERMASEDERSSNSLLMKIVWGGSIGAVAWVMTSFAGIDGIKMMSNLGGLPALLVVMGCNVVLVKYLLDSRTVAVQQDAVASAQAV